MDFLKVFQLVIKLTQPLGTPQTEIFLALTSTRSTHTPKTENAQPKLNFKVQLLIPNSSFDILNGEISENSS